MNNIILIGFMGSGKTTVGIRLSYHMRRTFVDTDKEIERQQEKEISQIFAQEGEPYFRMLETKLLEKMIETEHDRIISTGGGLAVKAENRALLKRLGTVVYLKPSPETVYERIKGDTKRPLLQCEDPLQRIRELMKAREEAYSDAADIVVDVDGKTFEELIQEIEGQCEIYDRM